MSYGWLRIGAIMALLLLDLHLASSLFGGTMSELFADMARAAGLWKAETTDTR